MEEIRTIRIHVEQAATHGMFIHVADPDVKEFPDLKEVPDQPASRSEPFLIDTDELGPIKTHLVGPLHSGPVHFHLAKWFKLHPELKSGDIVEITVMDGPQKTYHLRLCSGEQE